MNATEFPAVLDRMAVDFDRLPLTDALDDCHEHIVEGIRYMFETQTGPDGEAWPRRGDRATHPTLNRTGELFRAATGGAGHVHRTGYRELVVGVEKAESGSRAGAAVHQYGATIYPRNKLFLVFMVDGILRFARKVTIPARPYIGATTEAIGKCYDSISDAVIAGVFGR